MGPIPSSNGHDFPGLVDESVPGVAAVVEDIVVGCEDSVREPVVADELPDVLDRVELGRPGRQRQESDIFGNLEILGAMPTGLVEQDDAMSR